MSLWTAPLIHHPARYWILLFLGIQFFIVPDGGTNPISRWGTLASIVADGTVRTDRYYQHTMDWARTPDGHTFSNKAPGPALISLPIFWLLDRVSIHGATSREQQDERRVADRNNVLHWLSFLAQAVPFAVVTWMLVGLLGAAGVGRPALHFAAVALLFGNTASLFMNTFFGHGMTAMFVLATVLAVMKQWPFRAGLFIGLAILCDYGAVLVSGPLLLFLVPRGWSTGIRALGRLVAGGTLPASAWIAYHGYCFGGPFSLPNKYQNPLFVDAPSHAPNIWGVMRVIPDTHVLWKLVFGPERGLAFTQAWLLVTLVGALAIWRTRGPSTNGTVRLWLRRLLPFAAVSLVLLLVMNACFGGWHGGMTPGPRYLSSVLPVFALIGGIVYSEGSRAIRQLLWLTLALSVLLFVFVHATTPLTPVEQSLFHYYFNELTTNDQGRKLERVLFMTAGFIWAGARAAEPAPSPVVR